MALWGAPPRPLKVVAMLGEPAYPGFEITVSTTNTFEHRRP
jgi:hypothetical protein